MNGAELNGRPRRRRRRKEFAARSDRAGEMRPGAEGRAAAPGVGAGRPRGWRRRGAGRAMTEGKGRGGHTLHNPAAASARGRRRGQPRPRQDGRGPGRRTPPPRHLRPTALWPLPGGSAAPPGDACPIPPLPHPAAGPGVAHLTRCPRPPCPGPAAFSGLADPGPAAASALARDQGGGPGEGSPTAEQRRGPRSPTLAATNPALAPRWLSAPPPPVSARAAATPPSVPRARSPAPPTPPPRPRSRSQPRGARALLPPARGDPSLGRSTEAPGVGLRVPPLPGPALLFCSRPQGAAPGLHVTVSLAGRRGAQRGPAPALRRLPARPARVTPALR